MILKIKAKIYQYTGIFLARKEEEEYLNSLEGLAAIKKAELDGYNNGLVIGLWQADHGFVTFMVRPYAHRRSPFYLKVMYRLAIIVRQLQHDLGIK